ncbi:hypothetical protein [uncultured Psychroserpens sp.]|uniref:hypothetical protein n=1 Tax=uncultured Psychroserpens sp. TaxID=255436 RepID=UPI00260C7F25|nr:hypothetical protein [uncultured Psychroserpens sp.]
MRPLLYLFTIFLVLNSNAQEQFTAGGNWDYTMLKTYHINTIETYEYEFKKNGRIKKDSTLRSRMDVDHNNRIVSGFESHEVIMSHNPSYLYYSAVSYQLDEYDQLIYELNACDTKRNNKRGNCELIDKDSIFYSYENGKITSKKYYKKSTTGTISLNFIETYEYDSSGNLLKQYISSEDKKYLKTIYEYNEKQQLIKTTSLDNNEKQQRVTYYWYTKEGRIRKEADSIGFHKRYKKPYLSVAIYHQYYGEDISDQIEKAKGYTIHNIYYKNGKLAKRYRYSDLEVISETFQYRNGKTISTTYARNNIPTVIMRSSYYNNGLIKAKIRIDPKTNKPYWMYKYFYN